MRTLDHALRLLPPKERNLLRLLELRGASQRELAGALGISRTSLRRLIQRARRRVTDPVNVAILRNWRRLAPADRRLAYLHRGLGVPVLEIARLDLIPLPRRRSTTLGARSAYLRRRMREIERRARQRDWSAPGQPSPDAAGESSAAVGSG